MKVMLDLNVLLDVVQRREPFYMASAEVLSRAIDGRTVACLPSHALTTLHYIVGRHAGRKQAAELVDWALAHLEIVAQDRSQFVRARSLPFDDFEDAALASAAEAASCQLIITRNVTDFLHSPIPSVTPEEGPDRRVALRTRHREASFPSPASCGPGRL
jgi:predicted nucleic acid-binding protein